VGSRRSDRFQPPELATPYSLSEEAIGGPRVGARLQPVRAWIQLPDLLVRVDAEAAETTPDAVLVRFKHDTRTLEAWVWRAAVKRRVRPAPVTEVSDRGSP
jgi:hypothetical protein